MRNANGIDEHKPTGMSCAAKGCLTVVILAVSLTVIGILSGYIVLFHTAIPAKGIVAVLNKSPDIQIEGISGSINSGFDVETMRFTDENGNVNELDDVRLHYKKEGDTIVITEVHIGRGYFYVDRSTKEAEFKSEDGTIDTTEQTSESNRNSDLHILIQTVSINDITVEDVSTKETFVLSGVQLEDLKIDDGFSLRKLLVTCSTCDLSILPKDGDISSKLYVVDGTLKPEIHKNLTAPINLKGTVNIADKKNEVYDLKAFDGKLSLKSKGENTELMVKGFSFADYFKDAPPISDLTLDLSSSKKVATVKGSFTIGSTPFTINQTVELSENEEENQDIPIIGIHKSAGAHYKITCTPDSKSGEFFPKLSISSTPKKPVNDVVSTIITGKVYSALSQTEKTTVDKALAHFTK